MIPWSWATRRSGSPDDDWVPRGAQTGCESRHFAALGAPQGAKTGCESRRFRCERRFPGCLLAVLQVVDFVSRGSGNRGARPKRPPRSISGEAFQGCSRRKTGRFGRISKTARIRCKVPFQKSPPAPLHLVYPVSRTHGGRTPRPAEPPGGILGRPVRSEISRFDLPFAGFEGRGRRFLQLKGGGAPGS